MKTTLSLIILVLFSFAARAQDTIVKKDGSVLKVKVTEIGTDEVKFKSFGNNDGPIIVLKRSEVKKVTVGGQVVIDDKDIQEKPKTESILLKKDGTLMRIYVVEIGTSEVRFKLLGDPDGPLISVSKSEIRTLKMGDQLIIDNKVESEDQIVKMDGSILKVKVVDLGTNEIRYKLFGKPDSPTLSVKKKEVRTVKIEGQTVYEYKEDPYTTSNNSILDRTNDVKFEFFSPLFNYLALDYEWMNKPGFNWEVGAGVIGIGVSSRSSNSPNYYTVRSLNPSGFFVRGGPKFLLGNSSDLEVEGTRIAHPLKGRYFKVEAILQTMNRQYSYDTNGTNSGGVLNWEKKYQSLVLNLVYGRQNIYANVITVGYYVGFGYAIEGTTTYGNTPSNNLWWDYFDVQRFSHIYMGRNFPLTFTWGLTVGYIHKPRDHKGDKSYRNNPRA
ncbi:MAG TPA: hypothetical protein VI112_10645 [Bacteroidia bacterium]|jgi:hypothetical protein